MYLLKRYAITPVNYNDGSKAIETKLEYFFFVKNLKKLKEYLNNWIKSDIVFYYGEPSNFTIIDTITEQNPVNNIHYRIDVFNINNYSVMAPNYKENRGGLSSYKKDYAIKCAIKVIKH